MKRSFRVCGFSLGAICGLQLLTCHQIGIATASKWSIICQVLLKAIPELNDLS